MMETIGWVLYDDSCGFCRQWIPFWADTLRRRGLDIAPLQSAWVVERLNLPPDDLLSDLRLLLADGRQVRGADVYRYAMRRIWWAFPLYLLSIAPLLSRVFDWGYRTFADNRYHVSHACRLPAAGDRRWPNIAAKFVNSPQGQQQCLRGINARVVQGGAIRVGDPVRKIRE